MTTDKFKGRLLLAANLIGLCPLAGVYTILFGKSPAWLNDAQNTLLRNALTYMTVGLMTRSRE